MRCPIVLWMTSRSRSSMVAGIFAAHGINWGGKQSQSAGYNTFENMDVRACQKRHFGLPYMQMVEPTAEFIAEIYSLVPQNETYLVKTGIEYFDAFQPLIPFNIYLLRNPEHVAASLCSKRKGLDPDAALQAAEWRFKMMRARHSTVGGVFIDTDRVIAGDFTQLRAAVEICGVLFDENLTN